MYYIYIYISTVWIYSVPSSAPALLVAKRRIQQKACPCLMFNNDKWVRATELFLFTLLINSYYVQPFEFYSLHFGDDNAADILCSTLPCFPFARKFTQV